MKKLFLLIILNSALSILHCAFSQNPLVKMWDYRFGGNDFDNITAIQETIDGGFILGGLSSSGISGDKSQPSQGIIDFWIVKTDSLGVKQWDKDFGGTADDILYSIWQTSDSGFIMGGYSESGIGGDKTQASWGGSDYWIVKTDALGNKQWDMDFGGTGSDYLYSIQQTADKGFILGGSSISGISGDKSQPSWGNFDYWIVKTDSQGIKQWDMGFGGSADEWLYSIQQTIDSGFILGGYSNSGISGNKSQASWGVADYWIVKTDALGSKQWDMDFGGTEQDVLSSIEQTSDSGFILGGYSNSGISGNKSQATWGLADCWILKTDALGNKQWDKDFGGTVNEELFKVSQTTDGGYLISGDSYSPIGGDKTENNLGSEQTWVLKTDALGNKQWDKTILTSGHDETGLAIQIGDGCYLMSNFTNAGIAGYKSQASWNSSNDYWIIKFCENLHAGFSSPSSICPGTCIDFVNLSFQATFYQWSFPGATPNTSTAVNPTNICYSTPGSYDVELIASNANGSDTLLLSNYITVYPTPPPQGITQSGDTLFAIAGAAGYQWYFNSSIITGATDYFYIAPASGNYNVVATDNNGCEVEAVINNVIAGNSQLAVGSSPLEIFPNPVIDKFTIQKLFPIAIGITSETAFEISVYNVLGEKVMAVCCGQSAKADPSSGGWTVDCGHLAEGLYYLEISSGKKIYRTKFLKQ